MKITILPSAKGDCLLIEAGGVSILADGGMPDSYEAEVRPFLGRWAAMGNELDLVYVSHVDQDHIGGVLRMLEDTVLWRVHKHKLATGKPTNKPAFGEPPLVKRIWHNAFKALVEDNAGEIEPCLLRRRARCPVPPILRRSTLQPPIATLPILSLRPSKCRGALLPTS
ncbi:MBL fold metallo-hydrolase [Mesorhizobium sp. AaZ16]|uniref:MBL fold metallo-hydrolase n=1 Tax=Mesorhizobium sp. AaZ16 TaxID=3402289 RepID=UPI00374FA314